MGSLIYLCECPWIPGAFCVVFQTLLVVLFWGIMSAMTSIHSTYSILADEVPSTNIAFALDDRTYTYAEVKQELANESSAGIAYATAIAAQTLEFIANAGKSDAAHPGVVAAIRLDVSPRECVVEQYQAMPEDVPAWKTMSTTYTVRQMAALLDAREHDALVFLSNVVRICRDLIARRAAQSMPGSQTAV